MTNEKAKRIWNIAAFIAQSLIPILDELEESTQPQREFKYHLKRAILEGEKFIAKHFITYQNYGILKQPDGTEIHSRDVYNITAKAYDFLLNKAPHEIVSVADLIKSYEEGGVDWKDFDIEYKKIV